MTRSWVEVPLTKGMVAKIDLADMLIVGQWSWSVMYNGSGVWYAKRSPKVNKKSSTMMMHRWIMQPPPGMVVDHINHDGLDNRRANLRVCTTSQNGANRRGRMSTATSVFIGVQQTGRDSWCAATRGGGVNGADYLGSFGTAEEAARAYDAAVLRLHGPFATTNFPADK